MSSNWLLPLKIDFGSNLSDEDVAKIKKQFAESIQGDNWKMPIFNVPENVNIELTGGKLVIWPDSRLNDLSFKVTDENVKDLTDFMFEVMYANKGVGLSAIQIGVPLQVFVMDVSKDKSKQMICLNPVINKFLGFKAEVQEGCLSFPGIFETVSRYSEIVFTCNDLNGEVKQWQVSDLEAQVVAHEIDHLNGVTLGDKWGRVKRDINKRKIKKALAK